MILAAATIDTWIEIRYRTKVVPGMVSLYSMEGTFVDKRVSCEYSRCNSYDLLKMGNLNGKYIIIYYRSDHIRWTPGMRLNSGRSWRQKMLFSPISQRWRVTEYLVFTFFAFRTVFFKKQDLNFSVSLFTHIALNQTYDKRRRSIL
jgi:hypothetical protein